MIKKTVFSIVSVTLWAHAAEHRIAYSSEFGRSLGFSAGALAAAMIDAGSNGPSTSAFVCVGASIFSGGVAAGECARKLLRLSHRQVGLREIEELEAELHPMGLLTSLMYGFAAGSALPMAVKATIGEPLDMPTTAFPMLCMLTVAVHDRAIRQNRQ